jgi:acyl-homoserine lactone synthase
MFNERRKAFVERNGWEDLMVFDGAEVDEYDDEHAIYLMALNDAERLEGAVRIRPAMTGCMLVDHYPQLVAEDPLSLKAPDVWESTRVFITDAFRASRAPGVRGFMGLAAAAMEVVVDAGGKRMLGIVDVRMLDHMPDIGSEFNFTGLPAEYPYGVMVGTCGMVSDELTARMRESLAEPSRLSYEVAEDDLASFGSLAAIQRAVDKARLDHEAEVQGDKADPRCAMARVTALYAKYDDAYTSQPYPDWGTARRASAQAATRAPDLRLVREGTSSE